VFPESFVTEPKSLSGLEAQEKLIFIDDMELCPLANADDISCIYRYRFEPEM
jgi:hypothetical protein